MSSIEPLPAALPSMGRALKRGWQAEPGLLAVAFGLALLAALPDAFFALWLKLIANGLAAGRHRLVVGAAVGLGASAAATWFLKVIGDRAQRRFRDRITIALETHVARLQASIPTIEHQERPEYLDRLAVLRHQVFVLDHMYMSLFATCGWILRLGVTLALLATIHPALMLLAVFALPTVTTSAWRPGVERAAEEAGAAAERLARHLFNLATTAASAKEVRTTRIEQRLVAERRRAWERWFGPVAHARRVSAAWHALGWGVFAAAYVGAMAFVAKVLARPAGDVVLVLAAAGRLSAYVGATIGEIGFLRGIWLDGSRRLAWLEDYAAARTARARQTAPGALTSGIRFEHVSFVYPGTDRVVLEDVNLEIPPGTVVALVGENGAGKTTLVKLLCKLYEPTSGKILINGEDLAELSTASWRARLAGAFQDFVRFELKVKQAIGVGDVDRIDDESAVVGAVARAGASDTVEQLAAGLETQLGPAWPAGVDASFGQWQKLALARGFMRDAPLVLILDEPTAALDAETEHALFERYAGAARRHDAAEPTAPDRGAITFLVSHRFSTVRMVDHIVVLAGARIVEAGSHEQLLASGGHYAELYRIQAAAYS